MIYQRVRNHFPSRRFFLRSTAFVSISLASIVGIQSITQWSESPQAIASETYPGCNVPDRDWSSGDFPIHFFPEESGDQLIPIRSVAFSPDGELLASGHSNGIITVWRLQGWDGRQISYIADPNTRVPSPTGRVRNVTNVVFSPDRNFLVSGHSDGMVVLWDVSNYRPTLLEANTSHTQGRASVVSARFTRDGRLVTSAQDKFIRIWEIENGQLILLQEMQSDFEIKSLSISADERYIAVSGTGSIRNMVEVWDMNTGDLVNELGPYPKAVYAVAFHPCQSNILAFSSDSTSIPEVETQLASTNTIRLWDIFSGSETGVVFEGHNKEIETLAFSPSGNLLMSGSWDGTVRIWEAFTGSQIYVSQTIGQRVLSVAFSPSAQQFAFGLGETRIRIAGLDNTN